MAGLHSTPRELIATLHAWLKLFGPWREFLLINPSRTRLKIVAVVLGILMAGVPIVLFNAWLNRQADDEAASTAAWALGSSETRLGQAIAVLQELAAQGVDSCRPGHVEAMRQGALLTGPVKQIVLLGSNDEVLCADPGVIAVRHEVLTSMAVNGFDIVLDVVRPAERSDRFLRIRRSSQPNAANLGRPRLAALVPATLLLPQDLRQGGQPGQARMTMADGTPVGDFGATPDPAAGRADSCTHCRRSNIRWSSRFRCHAPVQSPITTISAALPS